MTKPINAPSLTDIDLMAKAALASLPEELLAYTADVVLLVQEFPDDDVCREMELETPFDILGLYQGISLADKQIESSGNMPDIVFLYRRPILDYWCETGEDLGHVVRHVLIHEIGHHFGFSDETMEMIEEVAEAEEMEAEAEDDEDANP
jgi:predicted Zn-dependent protease with MMP-like domain